MFNLVLLLYWFLKKIDFLFTSEMCYCIFSKALNFLFKRIEIILEVITNYNWITIYSLIKFTKKHTHFN